MSLSGDLRQLSSSEPSLQSRSPSQTQRLVMQLPAPRHLCSLASQVWFKPGNNTCTITATKTSITLTLPSAVATAVPNFQWTEQKHYIIRTAPTNTWQTARKNLTKRIYNFGAIGEKMNWLDFEFHTSKNKVTKRPTMVKYLLVCLGSLCRARTLNVAVWIVSDAWWMALQFCAKRRSKVKVTTRPNMVKWGGGLCIDSFPVNSIQYELQWPLKDVFIIGTARTELPRVPTQPHPSLLYQMQQQPIHQCTSHHFAV